MQNRFVEEDVNKGRDVSLYHKEEEFFEGDPKQTRPNNGLWWVGPYFLLNQVGIPWQSCGKGDEDEAACLNDMYPVEDRIGNSCEKYRQWYCEFQVTMVYLISNHVCLPGGFKFVTHTKA